MDIGILVSLADELLKVVRKRDVIEYSDLARIFRERYHYDLPAQYWGKPTGALSGICMENGLPPLSAVVINQDTRMPGSGFFDFAGRHLRGAPVPERDWESFWQEQLQRVYECERWDELPQIIAQSEKRR